MPRIAVPSGHAPFDFESGQRSKLRRIGRRGRYVVAAIVAGAVVYYLMTWRQIREEQEVMFRPSPVVQEDIAPVEVLEPVLPPILDKGKGKSKGKAVDGGPDLSRLEYVVDRYGDHFYTDYPNATFIPPFDPDLTQLPPPSELFPEIDLKTWFRTPKHHIFPQSRLREVISPPHKSIGTNLPSQTLPDDAFVLNWTGPVDWNKERKPAQKVQVAVEEDAEWRRIRKERGEAVKRGFAHAWQAYKDHAWGELVCYSELTARL